MHSVLSNRVLVLNKSWTPVGTSSLKRAMVLVFKETALIIEPEAYQLFTWDDWSKLRPCEGEDKLMSAHAEFRVPEVILLKSYDKYPKPRVHFSRRTLFKRDSQTCQYCGIQPGTDELTIDHIIPKAQGGVTSWENCALACVDCNRKKADKRPEQAGMKLLKQPKKPKFNLFKTDIKKPIKSWEQFLGECYWEVELSD